MKVVGITLLVLLAVVVFIAGGIWSSRGGLIDRSQAVDEKWSQVQNVYQRRFDLIPNLVDAVDNFMVRQQSTLTAVIGLRQRVLDLKGAAETALKQGNLGLLDSLATQLSTQMGSFVNVVVERYPDIKGEQIYSDLMTQLEGTENRITQERRLFNQTVREYNAYRQKGIGALIAGGIFGYPYQKEFFQAGEGADQAPDVKKLLQSP